MSYPTLAQLKTYLNISGSGDDTNIEFILDSAIKQVERYTSRVWVASSATREYIIPSKFINNAGDKLTFYEDLVSVTTLTNGDGDTIASADYDLLPSDGPPYYQLQLKSAQSTRFYSEDGDTVSLNGSWGHSTNCPDDIFMAILTIAALGLGVRHDGAAVSLSTKGTIIDKGRWPQSILSALDLRARS